jgi:hypothetical protein
LENPYNITLLKKCLQSGLINENNSEAAIILGKLSLFGYDNLLNKKNNPYIYNIKCDNYENTQQSNIFFI